VNKATITKDIIRCPDCNAIMVKTKIQCEDLSGWICGWICECSPDVHYDVIIHAKADWTAEQMTEAIEK